MRTLLIVVGVVLIGLSALALANRGISYTQREQVVDVGPIQASAETRETIEVPVPVAAGGLILGVGVLVAGVRRDA